jgi:hypothetical protein
MVEDKLGGATMVDDKQQIKLPLWKPLVFAVCGVGGSKLLHLWLPDPIAWAIGAFVGCMILYEAPPRIGSPPDFRKSILWSAATALLAFVLAKII